MLLFSGSEKSVRIFLASSAREANTHISQGVFDGLYSAAISGSRLRTRDWMPSFSRISAHILAIGSFGAVTIHTNESPCDCFFSLFFFFPLNLSADTINHILPYRRLGMEGSEFFLLPTEPKLMKKKSKFTREIEPSELVQIDVGHI
jgi:hypothetical protein